MNIPVQLLLELKQVVRNRSFVGLMVLLFGLMTFAAWNSHSYFSAKSEEVAAQRRLVADNDARLITEIDALHLGLDTFESSYTLPTSGIRLTYNNHRITWLPFQPLSLVAIGQADLFSNYRKVVLYNNDSYEMSTEELVSPLEQLFGQLDLSFVWVYLLPLIILLSSFNVLSAEKESGRLSLIASQPVSLSSWLLRRITLRFLVIATVLTSSTTLLLLALGVDLADNLLTLGQLMLLLLLYSGFWFVLSFLTNLTDFSSGKSLIVLTSIWVLLVFLVPSAVNLLAKEVNPIPSRLGIVNHHQAMYNDMEGNLDTEMEILYQRHPDWQSDDPVTKDMSHSTGWNINYLAKQYIAQLKHRPVAEGYERRVANRIDWLETFKVFSPSMVMQSALAEIAGTSTSVYRSYLRQIQEYTESYRQYVFKGIFTNHTFTSEEIRLLPVFQFDRSRVAQRYGLDAAVLLAYLVALSSLCVRFARRSFHIR